MHMPSDRRRIFELALESLQQKRKKLDEEIAEITRELKGGAAVKTAPAATAAANAGVARARKRSRFSKEERVRRSQRMKAYWDNWRKKKAVKK
jgi:hypothetical protein